jgi:hypothetical protein
MKFSLRAKLLAGVLALSAVSYVAAPLPAMAQDESDGDVSFQYFHDRLADYGDWVYSDRWGEVWVPEDVPADFHPYYSGGHWDYTDEYGWYWDSDYEWGDIAFHYGRWVNDPDDGWLWIPGYVWGPGWVVWRGNEGYTGWMPMPPDRAFLEANYGGGFEAGFGFGGGAGISINFGDLGGFFGYRSWYGAGFDEDRFARCWVFVGTGHLADHDYRPYIVNRTNVVNIIHNTTNITNYTVVNNYVVNRSVDVHMVERAGGHPVQIIRAADVIRQPALVTRVDVGHRAQMRAREEIPVGSGVVNSAPKPPPRVIQTLSTKQVVHGRESSHLFTKTTIDRAVSLPPTPKSFGPRTAPFTPGNSTVQPGGGGETQTDRAARMRQERMNERMNNMGTPSNPPTNAGPSGTTGETQAERAARLRQERMNERMNNMGTPPSPPTNAGPSGPTGETQAERAARLRQERANERMNNMGGGSTTMGSGSNTMMNNNNAAAEAAAQERAAKLREEQANQQRLNEERANQMRANQERATPVRAEPRNPPPPPPPPKEHGDKEKPKKGDEPH